MSDWRDISTAPKDGTTILLYASSWEMSWGEIQLGHFEGDGEGGGEWYTGEGSVSENDPDFLPNEEIDLDDMLDWDENLGPTHWMPLPAPPEAPDANA